MNILVCIKCVVFDERYERSFQGNVIRRKGKMMLNPYDLYALEEALMLKESFDENAKVIGLCMGPEAAGEVLKQLYYMGLDQVVLLTDERFASADTIATGYTLQKAIEKLGKPDIILCGQKSIDGDTSQVPGILASHLDESVVTQVTSIENMYEKYIVLTRRLEWEQQELRVMLPAVLGIAPKVNQPRPFSLRLMAKCRGLEVKKWNADDIQANVCLCGRDGSRTQVSKVMSLQQRQKCEFFEGETEDITKQLAMVLIRNGFLCSN